jgi:(2R)-3-sulfolactate dehydrogenase (NADP+)
MLPMGGAKGAMLALVVELLACALTGARWASRPDSFFVEEGNQPRIGRRFSSSTPARFAGREVYLERSRR